VLALLAVFVLVTQVLFGGRDHPLPAALAFFAMCENLIARGAPRAEVWSYFSEQLLRNVSCTLDFRALGDQVRASLGEGRELQLAVFCCAVVCHSSCTSRSCTPCVLGLCLHCGSVRCPCCVPLSCARLRLRSLCK
jgi:hypothetical protein